MSSVSDIRPWFREDIEKLLKAIYMVMLNSKRHPMYQQGFTDALQAIAVAVGIEIQQEIKR